MPCTLDRDTPLRRIGRSWPRGSGMDGPDARLKDAKRGPHPPTYSSRIIKAGALLPDAKTLLAHWDLGATAQDNMGRVRRDNVFGKASRSRVEDILAIFRQCYLSEPAVTRALVALVRGRLPAQALDRILYFHAARADRLLRDVVIEVLAAFRTRGISEAMGFRCP